MDGQTWRLLAIKISINIEVGDILLFRIVLYYKISIGMVPAHSHKITVSESREPRVVSDGRFLIRFYCRSGILLFSRSLDIVRQNKMLAVLRMLLS